MSSVMQPAIKIQVRQPNPFHHHLNNKETTSPTTPIKLTLRRKPSPPPIATTTKFKLRLKPQSHVVNNHLLQVQVQNKTKPPQEQLQRLLPLQRRTSPPAFRKSTSRNPSTTSNFSKVPLRHATTSPSSKLKFSSKLKISSRSTGIVTSRQTLKPRNSSRRVRWASSATAKSGAPSTLNVVSSPSTTTKPSPPRGSTTFDPLNEMNNNNNNSNKLTSSQVARQVILSSLKRCNIQDPWILNLKQQVQNMFVKETWTKKASLLSNAINYMTETNDQQHHLPTDLRLINFVLDRRVLRNNKLEPLMASTQLDYAKNLKTLMVELEMGDSYNLSYFLKSRRVMMASQSPKQAPVMTDTQLQHLLHNSATNNPRLQACIYLAYKTASRWGDLVKLVKANFIIHHQCLQRNEIVICWGSAIKTSRVKPFRPVNFTVLVEEKHPHLLRLLKSQISKLKKDQLLCPKSTNQMLAWLKKDRILRNLTCHSFKRTTLDKLVQFIDQDLLDFRVLPIMAKHQDKQNPHFPESTIRYINNKVLLARMFGTQKATRLL